MSKENVPMTRNAKILRCVLWGLLGAAAAFILIIMIASAEPLSHEYTHGAIIEYEYNQLKLAYYVDLLLFVLVMAQLTVLSVYAVVRAVKGKPLLNRPKGRPLLRLAVFGALTVAAALLCRHEQQLQAELLAELEVYSAMHQVRATGWLTAGIVFGEITVKAAWDWLRMLLNR